MLKTGTELAKFVLSRQYFYDFNDSSTGFKHYKT
jgi:hypothetical protein